MIAAPPVSDGDPRILAPEQIAAIQTDAEAAGRDALRDNVGAALGEGLSKVPGAYPYTGPNGEQRFSGEDRFRSELELGFSNAIAIYGNGNTTGTPSIELSQQDGTVTRDDLSQGRLPRPTQTPAASSGTES